MATRTRKSPPGSKEPKKPQARKKPGTQATRPRPSPTLSEHVRFEVEDVPREKLLEAPYNPRQIREANADKLRGNLKRVGLLEPIVWNRRTGHVVSGHQRLKQLDRLHRTNHYLVRVAVVDLDEQTEREQNVFLNNPDAQGEWDMGMMEKLIRDDHICLENAGLEMSEIVETFGQDVLAGQSEKLEEMSAALKAAQETYEKIRQGRGETDAADYYCVLVGADRDAAEWLAEWLEMPGQIFLPLHRLREKIQAIEKGAS